MKFSKLSLLVAISALLLCAPMFATITEYSQPVSAYTSATTDFGGGDGSLSFTSSLGPFTYSNPQSQNNVPGSWATWGTPPDTESAFPNVLFNAGFSTLHVDISDAENTAGFELEPDNFAVETIDAVFHFADGSSHTITRDVDGSGGARLFALTNDSSNVVSIDITDEAGGDFATAQWRSGNAGTTTTGTTPEPSTMMLLGSGLLGAIGVIRRKINL